MGERSKKQRRRLLSILSVSIVVILIGLLGAYAYQALKQPLPTLQATPVVFRANSPSVLNVAWPDTPMAAIGMADYGVLETHGAQKSAPIASVAKVITSIMLLKAKPFDIGSSGETYTITQADVDLYNSYKSAGGSVTAVTLGEQLSEYQMLQAIMLPSSNNLADTAAIWAYDSLPNYATAATTMLSSLGLKNTHIGTDASGFSPTTTSTAADLVVIGNEAQNYNVLREIVQQKTADIPVAGTVLNVNWLLGSNGINGIKTGNTDQAGGVYLFSAGYTIPAGPTVTIVGSIVGAANLSTAMNQAVPLLQSAQKGFSQATVITKGEAVGYYAQPWSNRVAAVATKPLTSVAWRGVPLYQPRITLAAQQVPQVSGKVVGGIVLTGTDQRTTAVLNSPLTKPPLLWRLTHYTFWR